MKKNKNGNLHKAKAAKNDEFFTQLSDIEKECAHYADFFKGKVVYCNCDDARGGGAEPRLLTTFRCSAASATTARAAG